MFTQWNSTGVKSAFQQAAGEPDPASYSTPFKKSLVRRILAWRGSVVLMADEERHEGSADSGEMTPTQKGECHEFRTRSFSDCNPGFEFASVRSGSGW
jgi:hypothetical protein